MQRDFISCVMWHFLAHFRVFWYFHLYRYSHIWPLVCIVYKYFELDGCIFYTFILMFTYWYYSLACLALINFTFMVLCIITTVPKQTPKRCILRTIFISRYVVLPSTSFDLQGTHHQEFTFSTLYRQSLAHCIL